LRLFGLSRHPRRSRAYMGLLAVGWLEFCAGSVGMVTQSQAQQLLPDSHIELADQDRFTWNVKKVPAQPYMNEVYWRQYSAETPAFFRDSFLQYVVRTFDFTSDNFNGSKSQALTARSCLYFATDFCSVR
jgi:hypothetical protein